MAAIRLLRHATLLVEFDDIVVLVDPMLAEPGELPPIPNTPNERRNPLVALPKFDPTRVDAVLVTHTHVDHFDDTAREGLPRDRPLFCQPPDGSNLRDSGFTAVTAVDDRTEWSGVTITRTPARHGNGALAEELGPVAGFVLEPPAGPTVYVTGDTVWYDAVERTLDEYDPDIVVANAGAAQFLDGDPVTMTREDVASLADASDATVVAVHMDAVNHCTLGRAALRTYLADEAPGLAGRVVLPEDGERIEM